MNRRGRALASLAGVLAFAGPALTACQEDAAPPETGPVTLTFGVYGTASELAAYEQVVDTYNEKAVETEVELRTWPDEAAMADALAAGDVPDVYLLERHQLPQVLAAEQNQPLFDLLEARNVSYGDDYAQRVIEAFSVDDDLQCMPYASSPLVVYLNRDLVDFDTMAVRGLPVPEDLLAGWTFEEFAAAATYASRGASGTGGARGVGIEPSIETLAPFLLSGGGQVFDDATEPTSLTLEDGGDLDALGTTIDLLRDPRVTLDGDQLAEASPQEWFERGALGMVVGSRALTPRLRDVEGLDFDVMPLPSLGTPATVGDVYGLCVAPGDHVQPAADFLVHAISDEAVAPVVETGYLVPATLRVARSDVFLQPTELPAHAGVFNLAVDTLQLLPVTSDDAGLAAAVDPLLRELLTEPVLPGDLGDLAAGIDEVSRAVIDPDYEPSPATESADPSGG